MRAGYWMKRGLKGEKKWEKKNLKYRIGIKIFSGSNESVRLKKKRFLFCRTHSVILFGMHRKV